MLNKHSTAAHRSQQAMSHTVRIIIHSLVPKPRISQSWLEIVCVHVIMLCVYLGIPQLRGWPSRSEKQEASQVNKSWCYESWSIIMDFLPRIMADLTWQKQTHFM